MKKLFIIALVLILQACHQECYQPFYEFDAWEEANGRITIYYSAGYDYFIFLGCDDDLNADNAEYVIVGKKGKGTHNVPRFCTPMYIKVVSDAVNETIAR